jgi:anti-sigma regulatory factor (Ser/Thr protein kinase)
MIPTGVPTVLPPNSAARRDRASTGGATRGAVSVRLPGGPEAAGSARAVLSRLRSDLDPPLLETARLLVTELIANSVKHAEAQAVSLDVLVGDRSVVVAVTDEGPGFEPSIRVDGQDEASGWGLFLVERLSQRWGVSRGRGGTRVWFELPRG